MEPALKERLETVNGVRSVGPGVIEIVAYAGRAAAMAWLVAIAFVVALVVTSLDEPSPLFPSVSDRFATQLGYGLIWGPIGEDAGYRGCVEGDLYDGCHPDLSPSDYYFEIFLPNTYDSGALSQLVFYAVLFAAPFLFLLLWRRPPPVRIDGIRRIVYTVRGGQLYIARYTTHELVVPAKNKFDAVAGDVRSGPVRLRLTNGSRDRIFPVGHFAIFPNETRASEAWALAKHVLGSAPEETSTALPDRFRMPWWTRTSLLGPRRLPRTLDARVDAWVEANRDIVPQ